MTSDEFNALFEELKLSRKAWAEALRCDPKTIANWLRGEYAINAEAGAAIQTFADKTRLELQHGEQTTLSLGGEETRVPPYLRRKGTARLLRRLKVSQADLSRILRVSGASVSFWVSGKGMPHEKYHAQLKELWERGILKEGEALELLDGPATSTTAPKKTRGGALKKPLQAASLLQTSTEFYNMYRADRNRKTVEAILVFASEKMQLEVGALRQAVALILLTLKHDMDVEEMYKHLAGHE